MISWRDLKKTAWIHSQVYSNIRFCKVNYTADSYPFLVLRRAARVWLTRYLMVGLCIIGRILESWVIGLMNTPGTGKSDLPPLFSNGEAASGVLCPVQGSPVQGRHWQTRGRQANSPRVVGHRTFRETLGQLSLLKPQWEKAKGGEKNIIAVFRFPIGG